MPEHVLAENRRVRGLDQVPQVARKCFRGGFGHLAVVDVDARPDDLDGVVVRVAHQHVVVAQPAVRAVREAEAVFECGDALRDRALHESVRASCVFRVQVVAPEVRLAQIVAGRVAELGLDVGTDKRAAEISTGLT